MIHDAFVILVLVAALPLGLYLLAFLVALVDCVLSVLFPHPTPPLSDDSFDPA